MTFWHKLSKKHYIQFLLTFLLTGLFLYISSPLYSSHTLTVSFDAESKKEIDYQVFYTTDKRHPFNETQSIRKKISAGNQHVEITLPIWKIARFRLDLGSYPQKVIIKNLKIIGRQTLLFKNITLFSFNQIDKHLEKNGIFEFYSKQIDPYITYKNILSLKARCSYDFMPLVILSVLSFLIFYKLVQYLSTFKLKNQHSRIDIVFLTVFFGLLCLPMSHISNAEKSEQENRTLAKYFPFIVGGVVNYNYGAQFDKWFNDRFWGRKSLIQLFDIIKYKLNPHAGNDKVLIGLNGWLFYKLDNSVNNFANNVELPEKKLKQGLKYLTDINKWCQENGKEFYYVIAPDKNKIYGEYYRFVSKKRPDSEGIGYQFINYIHEHSDIKAIYLRDELMKHKNKGLLYYKHDTHWNDLGAYYGYLELMKLMDVPAKTYNFTSAHHKGDLEKMIDKVSEDTTLYKKSPLNFNTYCLQNDEKSTYNITCRNLQKTKNLFMLRDSFTTALLPYLSSNFHKIQTYHYNFHPVTQDDLQNIKDNYDIVILENVERYIPQILNLSFPQNIKD